MHKAFTVNGLFILLAGYKLEEEAPGLPDRCRGLHIAGLVEKERSNGDMPDNSKCSLKRIVYQVRH